MRLKELFEIDQSVSELSYTDPGIGQHLLSLKYKPAGEGGDQTTWQAPDGSILKIFGTQKGQQGETKDHLMFKFWANYAKKNAANPYMPKFSGWAQFEFPQGSGQQYLQIKMERLSPITDETTQEILDAMSRRFDANSKNYSQFLNLIRWKLGPEIAETNPAMNPKLFALVKKLDQIASENGWGLDLHADNYMMRGNQLVIVDPWVASS